MEQSISDNKKIAIIGAGPVGLTLARLLQQKGAIVTVYERDKNAAVRITGGTLDLHKNTGQLALKKAGLSDAFYKIARPTPTKIADMHGHILFEEKIEAENAYERPEIDRNQLRQLLLTSLHKGTVCWDRKFLSLEEKEGETLLHFENNITEQADVVIGANGGMSKIRNYITSDVPQHAGIYAIQGELLHPDSDCPDFINICGKGNFMVLDEQKTIGVQTRADGSLVYYVSFKESASWALKTKLTNKDSILLFLNTLFLNWADCYKELFAATTNFSILQMKKMPLEKEWDTQNIALVGDAAHLMPPFAGVGVNIGLLDAIYLSDNLGNGKFRSIAGAIKDYEKNMFAYASAAQAITMRAGDDLHSGMPVETFMNNLQHYAFHHEVAAQYLS